MTTPNRIHVQPGGRPHARVDAPPNHRRLLAAVTALTLVAILAGSAFAAPGGNQKGGFRTTVPAMLMEGADAPDGVVIEPIISVGEPPQQRFVFEFDPGRDLVHALRYPVESDLYVNHETSRAVPVPAARA